MCRYRVGDLHVSFVLSKILHKFSVRSDEVHDDGVIDLETARGEVQTEIFSLIRCVVMTCRMINNRAGL